MSRPHAPRPLASFDYAELNRAQREEARAEALVLWTLRIVLPLAVWLVATGGAA